MKKLRHILPEPHAWLLFAVVLYLLSFLFDRSFTIEGSIKLERNRLESFIHKKQKEFIQLAADTSLIKRLSGRTETYAELEKIADGETGFFIFRKSPAGEIRLTFWSNQYSFPGPETLAASDGEYFRHPDNGYFVSVRKTIADKNDSLIIIGMIPVLYDYNYSVDDKSLLSEFIYSKSAFSRIAISDTATADPVSALSGKNLFYISPLAQSIGPEGGDLNSFLKIMATLLLLLYIHFMAEKLSNQFGFRKGLGFLASSLVVLRLLSYLTTFPVNLRQFELFDPGIYASTNALKSLGDLLINAALFCWIILFAGQKLDSKDDHALPGGKKTWFLGSAAIIVIVLFTFLTAFIVRSLAADSSISFDVINFFSLSTFTFFGFLALAIISVGYYYFMRIMVPFVAAAFNINFYIVYLIVAVSGLIYLTFSIDNPLLPFYIIVLSWLIFYTRLLRYQKFAINDKRQTMAGALFWIFLFSVSITAIIINANRQKEWEQRKERAEKIDRRTDPNEAQLNISLIGIDDGFLTRNFYRLANENTSRSLRDSILLNDSYLSQIYNSRLYVFDANKNPVFNDEPETFNMLETRLQVEAIPTNVAHLFYYETTFGKFTFIFKREVKDEAGKMIGYVFLLSEPGRYTRESIYPELFKRSDQANSEEALGYSYGIYINDVLTPVPFNKYSFATIIDSSDIPPGGRFGRISRGNYDELWYKATAFNEKIIVVARKKDTILEAITLFSYIFCVFLFLVAFFNMLAVAFRVGGNMREFRRLMQWNIRTQIHSTIILVSVLSFIIIGIATISFFIRRYDQNNEERLSRTMEIVIREMEKDLDDRRAVDDQLPIYDSVSNEAVRTLVDDVADIHDVDVNVYDTSGNLHVTSEPLVYRNGVLSKAMHPLAFYHLNRLNEVQFVQQEKLSSIRYLSIYSPLRGRDGIAYAYINIPYFSSESGLKQEISNFLVAIINLNAFIFLIAGVIALFITNRVTRSFSLISEKMKEVNLGKNNEEIEWKRNDEIGGLVKEYNKMVKKLEGSAAALARSEREGAWREMARQVAHEIKNPLTPMKLSIQYLQKSIDNNSGNVKELTANVAKTLVEQIDHLSKIAFDFSQFANIGNTNIETFDINEVIRSLDNLYKTNTDVELELNIPDEKIMVKADKTQMNRLFTNLLQNAIEACDGKEICKIELNEIREDGLVRISVKDDGVGIPADMQSKIFIPNFTTKTSGTGLGLAMCQGIVEQAGGKIWFETTIGKGSIFYVELPAI